jgi:NAD(P)-dependent dehydrogenase (short-subunit alcohol dehydrogenase family)
VLTAREADREKLEAAGESIGKVAGDAGKVLTLVADASTEEGNRTAVAAAVEKFGGLDAAFLNAGALCAACSAGRAVRKDSMQARQLIC